MKKMNCPRGFTLVELLVVITIIAMLMALLVPAVGAARRAARKAQCASNMRQMAQALQVHESTKGELPGRVNAVGINDTTPVQYSTISWVAKILPELERSDIYDFIRQGLLHANVDTTEIPRLDIILCPEDVQVSGAVPALSYVANAGHWDVPRDGLPAGDFDENGIFFGTAVEDSSSVGGWRVSPNSVIKMRFEQVQDGVATTLLISENVQAGPPDQPSGSNLEPRSWLFSPTEQGDAFVWVNFPSVDQARISYLKEESPTYTRRNPEMCRPASNHADGVNAAFCDGHVDFLRQDIDYKVYYQLMTPRGRKGRLPPRGDQIADVNPDLAVYLLNERDYR